MDAEKALIIMTSGPDDPRRCATPFFLASVGRAMDYDVTMYFTIDGTLLLRKGVAEKLYAKPGGKPLSEFLRDALDAGVKFLACTASMELHNLERSDLIDGVKLASAAALWQAAKHSSVVLSF
ncbi:MAG: DsrE/DsrF/DrsH-like family protein [Chloroflexota bacterium]